MRTCAPNALPLFLRHSTLQEISCKICSPGDSRAAAPTSTASPARRPLQYMEVDPASFNASRCSPDVSGGSPKNLYRTPRQSVSPLYRGLLCARLGRSTTEGRRLDAESRTEAPLRHLPGPRATAIKCVNIRLEKKRSSLSAAGCGPLPVHLSSQQ